MSAQIEFYDELKQYLLDCQSPNNEQRSSGEENVRNLRDQDTKKFLATLVKEIADQGNNTGSRQLACIITKNLISNRVGDNRYEDLWISFENDFRLNIKEAILSSLASNEPLVRAGVASLIASICAIEIPRNEWLELLPNLCNNASNDSMEIRLAALQTIGYICEEIDPRQVEDSIKNQILLALTNNISAEDTAESPCKLAIKALLYSVPYATQNFQVAQERDFIMNKIFEALTAKNETIRENAMQCLVEFGKQEYESIEFYFQKIAEVTSKAALSDETNVGAQGIEFWTSIAEEELERLKRKQPIKEYIKKSQAELIGLILQGIQKVSIEDDEDVIDEEWGVNMSSGCCLQKLSLLLGNEVMPLVIDFVSKNIESQDWQKRYSALIALGSITEGPEKVKFNEVLVPSFEKLVTMFKDQSQKVREAISWVMSKVCEHHAEVVSSPQAAPIFIQQLVEAVKDVPKVSNQACSAFEKLSESLAPYDNNQSSNALTPLFDEICNVLLQNSHREDFDGTNVNLRLASFSALIALCQNCCTDSFDALFNRLFPVLGYLEETIQQVDGPNSDKARDFQDSLAGLCQVILVKVGYKVDNDTGEKIVQLLIQIFQSLKKVTENGLICYSGLCTGLGNRVNVKDFGQYIVWALEGEDEECTRIACGIVSDIASALEEGVSIYLSSFVPQLLKVLKQAERDRRTKLQALQTLGDLSIYGGGSFCSNYLQETLQILESASKMSTNVTDFKDDQDTLEYLEELRSTIIESYTTIIQGVKDSNTQQIFLPSVGHIIQFIEQVCQPNYNPRLETINSVTNLIGDLADCCGKSIAQQLRNPFIEQLVLHLRQQPDQESKETAEWTYQKITEALQS